MSPEKRPHEPRDPLSAIPSGGLFDLRPATPTPERPSP
jgi:hypothetical protein